MANILWVSAHPSPRSLNAALRRAGIERLRGRGETVVESDLYAMGWNPVLDAEGFTSAAESFHPTEDVRAAYLADRLPADIAGEQRKLRDADAVVLQFPLWWYGMPAILKGWFDRVFHSGFAFGIDPESGRRLRFEQGPFRDKRALVVTTLGDRPRAIGPRGKSGEFGQLMFGLLHGTLAYTGMQVLPPVPIPSADRMDAAGLAAVTAELGRRLDGLLTDAPIAYRPQFTGDYTDEWELVDAVRPGECGLDVHIVRDDEACCPQTLPRCSTTRTRASGRG